MTPSHVLFGISTKNRLRQRYYEDTVGTHGLTELKAEDQITEWVVD
jgi:hypothetical protein